MAFNDGLTQSDGERAGHDRVSFRGQTPRSCGGGNLTPGNTCVARAS
jgi:hypothetical protein